MPLSHDRGYADEIALGWEGKFGRIVDSRPTNFRFLPNTVMNNVVPSNGFHGARTAILSSGVKDWSEEFEVILSCVGLGAERRSLGPFASFGFWESDYLSQPDLGISTGRRRVLISGGGDGALQDFLRVATDLRGAREIYQSLQASVPPDAIHNIEREIQDAEDQAQRSYIWSLPNHDHAISEFLQKKHVDVIAEIMNAHSPALRDWHEKTVSSRLARIAGLRLAFPCTHFTQCYALNRFLSLLIARTAFEFQGLHLLLPNARVASITSQTMLHSCNGDPEDCYAKEHEVTFEGANCRGAMEQSSDGRYDVIVLRHGLDKGLAKVYTLFDDNLPMPRRQLLPYFWSW
jgi:hypothetical protein